MAGSLSKDIDMGSGPVVRFIGIGSVSGLNSFIALVDWEGLSWR